MIAVAERPGYRQFELRDGTVRIREVDQIAGLEIALRLKVADERVCTAVLGDCIGIKRDSGQDVRVFERPNSARDEGSAVAICVLTSFLISDFRSSRDLRPLRQRLSRVAVLPHSCGSA